MKDQSLLGALEADEEYRIIETALLETPRGRWFLTEHGRRSRRIDAALLEEAVQGLQASLREPPALLSVLRNDVERLRAFVAHERDAMQAAEPASSTGYPAADDAQANHAGILTAAEDLHALVWSMRAQLPTPDLCEAIARQSARIYAMSHAQAVQSTRTAHFSGALEETYTRLSAMLETILGEMQSNASIPRRPAYLPNGTHTPR